VAAGTGVGSGRRLGVALLVIAAAQLMVVLDTAIVNVALPHMQRALGFSGTGLEWVVNAYALTFGGLMLLGGRAGDLLGRRKMFIAGLVLFTAASMAGGLATSQAWLIATTFPEGKPRNQAMGVYAAMSAAGGAVGLIAGGLLTSYVFFFLTLFLQVVWGYSALKAGLAYLPMTAAIGVVSGAAAQLTPRVGALPTVAAGAVIFGGGLYWLSRLSVDGSYLHTILGPTLVAGAGLGLLFVPLTVVAMAKVAEAESGVAASLRNTAQQLGGSIGLAVLGTIAYTTAANTARAASQQAGIYQHALTTGFARGFEAAAAVMLLALIIAVATIRIRKAAWPASTPSSPLRFIPRTP
jgi:MFS family permease